MIIRGQLMLVNGRMMLQGIEAEDPYRAATFELKEGLLIEVEGEWTPAGRLVDPSTPALRPAIERDLRNAVAGGYDLHPWQAKLLLTELDAVRAELDAMIATARPEEQAT